MWWHGITAVGKTIEDAVLQALRLESGPVHLGVRCVADNPTTLSETDVQFFASSSRQKISRSTEWAWESYVAEEAADRLSAT